MQVFNFKHVRSPTNLKHILKRLIASWSSRTQGTIGSSSLTSSTAQVMKSKTTLLLCWYQVHCCEGHPTHSLPFQVHQTLETRQCSQFRVAPRFNSQIYFQALTGIWSKKATLPCFQDLVCTEQESIGPRDGVGKAFISPAYPCTEPNNSHRTSPCLKENHMQDPSGWYVTFCKDFKGHYNKNGIYGDIERYKALSQGRSYQCTGLVFVF